MTITPVRVNEKLSALGDNVRVELGRDAKFHVYQLEAVADATVTTETHIWNEKGVYDDELSAVVAGTHLAG